MYSSPDSLVKFRIVKPMISDVIDIFGKDIRFFDEKEDTVCVAANVNEDAMLQFAKNFAPDVVILAPEILQKRIKEELKKGFEIYK